MSKKKNFKIGNEHEFQSIMKSVDEELQKNGISIEGRPIKAGLLISKRYGIVICSSPLKKIPTPESYENFDLGLRIKNWFEEKYGNKLKIDPTWKMAILIRSDIYRMRLPLISGNIRLNLFDLIDDLTPTFVNSLNAEDIESIKSLFYIGFNSKSKLERLMRNNLINLAKNDFEAAVFHLFTTPPNYSLSKWASLQATEKTIKAFSEAKNGIYKRGHNLTQLADEAESAGLKPIPRNKLDTIQCSAEVRYKNGVVSLSEAVLAHLNSLEICGEIADQIFKLN